MAGKCDVNLIKDVNLSKNGFDELVLPVRTWELIKSLVDTVRTLISAGIVNISTHLT